MAATETGENQSNQHTDQPLDRARGPLLIVVPPLAADRAVGRCDVLAIVPNRLESLDGGSLLQTPVQSFVIPPKTAFWAESRGDVLAVSPETASLAITPMLATENIRI